MKSDETTKILLVAAAAVAAFGVQAAVSMPHVFGDNMVLQSGQRVPVWGKAAPGEKVSVAFAAKSDDLVLTGKPESRLYRQPVAKLTVRGGRYAARRISVWVK